jgi:hypothetical protein
MHVCHLQKAPVILKTALDLEFFKATTMPTSSVTTDWKLQSVEHLEHLNELRIKVSAIDLIVYYTWL